MIVTRAVKSSATLALARKKHLQCYTLAQIFNSLKFDSAPLNQHCWVGGCRLSSFLRQLALHIPKFHFVGTISSVCQLIFLIRYGRPTTKSMQIIQTGNKICEQSQSSLYMSQCLEGRSTCMYVGHQFLLAKIILSKTNAAL